MYKKLGLLLAMVLTVNSASVVFAEDNYAEKTVIPMAVDDDEVSGSVIDYQIDGGNIQINLDTGTIVSSDTTVLNAILPALVNDKEITDIGKMAFSNRKLITVVIPEGYKNIGQMAFSSCHSLEEITLPESLEIIDAGSLALCTSLEKIRIPDNVTSVSALAFAGCLNLAEVVLSVNTVSIEREAFSNCKSLTEITIPESIEYIDTTAFNSCESLAVVYCKKGSVADNQALYPLEVTFVYTDDMDKFVYGDADNDRILTANDAAVVLQKVMTWEYEIPLQNATESYMDYINVDGDASLTASDAANILYKAQNRSFVFPIEGK